MPFTATPPKKNEKRRMRLTFRSNLTPAQFRSFKKALRGLAKRFKLTVTK
jgi:hypothetical protein